MSTRSRIEMESHKDPHTLEREIDTKRAEIRGAVEALEHKLSPGELFERALEVAPGARDAFLEAECDDAGVRAEVRSLLAAAEVDGPLDVIAPRMASLHDVLGELRRDTRNRTELRGLFVQLLLEVALSKSALHRRERAVLWTICSELGIGRVELAQLEAMLRAQRGFRKSAAGSADAVRLAHAYEVLGVNGSSSNAEIKQAYRRLMNRNHPDKVSGRGDAAALLVAQQRTREIRSAWDMLKTRRSIR